MLKPCATDPNYDPYNGPRRSHRWGNPQFHNMSLKLTWNCADCGEEWVQFCREPKPGTQPGVAR